MQVLGLNLDWAGFLARTEDMVWLGAVIAVAVAMVLMVCAGAMVLYALREAGAMLPESDFMGFGRPLRRAEGSVPGSVSVHARRGPVLARIAAAAGVPFSH